MTAFAKALEQDNLELRSMGGRSSDNHTSLSEIPETAASAIATNATTVIMEEMKREQKKTAAQMKQLTAMLLSSTTNTTPLPATTPPAADGVFYNLSVTCLFRHPLPKTVQTSGLLRGKPIHNCSSCTKNWVTHADRECFKLETNASKRRPGWESYFL